MTYTLPSDNDTDAIAAIWADYYSSKTQKASEYLVSGVHLWNM
jgi:hypothetical protein